jgi:transposase
VIERETRGKGWQADGALVHGRPWVPHGRITRQGNPVVRSALVESSWILIGKDPEMRRFYDKIKVRRGGKRAIVAVARKLCHRLLAIAHSSKPYQVNFSQTREN